MRQCLFLVFLIIASALAVISSPSKGAGGASIRLETNTVDLSKSCDRGVSVDCNELGFLLATGDGVRKDEKAAAKYFQKACDGGNKDGCFNVALIYTNENSVVLDKARAINAASKACSQKLERACRLFDKLSARSTTTALRATEDRESDNITPRTSNQLAARPSPSQSTRFVQVSENEEKMLNNPNISPVELLNLCEKGIEKACQNYIFNIQYLNTEPNMRIWRTQRALLVMNRVCENRDKYNYQSRTGSSYTTWCIGRDQIQTYLTPIRRSASGTTLSERKSCIASAKRPTNAYINKEEFDTVSGRILKKTSEPIYETGMYNKCTYPISVDCISRRNEKSIVIEPSAYISPSVCVLQFIN